MFLRQFRPALKWPRFSPLAQGIKTEVKEIYIGNYEAEKGTSGYQIG